MRATAMMRVKEFGRLDIDVQNDLLRSAYKEHIVNHLINDDVFCDLKLTYDIAQCSNNSLKRLTDEVDLLEYRYISGFDKNYDCIEYLRELLYKEGILLAKIPCKCSYRRYSIGKEPLDAVKVYVLTVKEGFTGVPSTMFTGDMPMYIVCKYLNKRNECMGYINYYLSCESRSKESDMFTITKGNKLFLLRLKNDLSDSLRSGFKNKIIIL